MKNFIVLSTVNPKIKLISTDPNYIQNQISIFGAGTWDLMGSSTFKTKSSTFSSHGGDFRRHQQKGSNGNTN